ncbi:hypothetical protein PG989_014646 [Apiospora arundinis]
MDYQQKIGNQYRSFYKQSGRGFLDVAAQANNVLPVNYGPAAPTSGTSASAPIFAAIISLLNNARIKKGMPPRAILGCARRRRLADITTGGSLGCPFKSNSSSGQLEPDHPLAAWNATVG